MNNPQIRNESDQPVGIVTFMFTDVEGSSRMWEADQPAAREALSIHDSLIISAVKAAGGVIVKSRGEGDSHFAVFEQAGDALNAAASIQRALNAQSWPTAKPLRVRMALNTGEADLRQGDYYGTTVNRTARIRAVGYGGQILLASTTAERVADRLPQGVTLQDLGRHRLKDLSLPEQLYQVDIAGLQTEFPPVKSLNLKTHNLPAQSTSFVGRTRDIAQIGALLNQEDVRLVTLSGPGGTGKTRLALRVAEENLGRYPDGVFFVPLAETTSSELLISKTARELDVREGGNQPLLRTLTNYLRDKEILLILDNFEQVVDAATVVADLLAAAPLLKIVVTSRTLLNLRAEHNYPVSTLNSPGSDAPITVEELHQNEATRLFLERAAAANPRLAVTGENAPLIAEICRRLDGLPLAIELAAARLRVVSLESLLSRLSHRLKLLTGGARDLPQRQQTLRKAIDWSYDLLAEDEQKLLARLSIFAGGFMMDAAEEVCGIDDDLDVFSGIELLLDNSLLKQQSLADGTMRFEMLLAIRDYAAERLQESGELGIMIGRHSQYYGERLQKIGFDYFTSGAIPALDWTDLEHDNLRALLSRSLATPEGRAIAPHLALGLTWFWYRRGFMSEGREWSERILAAHAAQDRTAARSLALGCCAVLAMWQGDLNTAYTYAQETLDVARWVEEPFSMAFSLMNFGIIHVNSGEERKSTGSAARSAAAFPTDPQRLF